MPTPLRFIPDEIKLWTDSKGRPIAIVEVTIRTVLGMFLLVPKPKHVRILLGVLGRALQTLDFELFGYGYLSDHGSLIFGVRDEAHQARIMEFVHGNIARELGRKEYSDWPTKFWSRRGRPIPILSDEDLLDRMRYLLSNSTKENLVECPTQWPGAHCARALCTGQTDSGLWINRTGLYYASRRKDPKLLSRFESEVPVPLSRLPQWAHLPAEENCQRFQALCSEIAEEARLERLKTGKQAVLGAKTAVGIHPHYRPKHLATSPAPLAHCKDLAKRRWFIELYNDFRAAFREAAAALRAGLEPFGFCGGIPPGCHFKPTIDTS